MLISRDETDATNITELDIYYGSLAYVMANFSATTLYNTDFSAAPTRTTECPTKSGNWTVAGATLPPTPNDDVVRTCKCMMSSIQCIANEKTAEAVGDVEFDSLDVVLWAICGEDFTLCNGTTARQDEGRYGAFNGCTNMERLSWAMSYWSRTNTSDHQPCTLPENPDNPRLYAGLFSVQEPQSPDAECKFLLDQAGPEGTATITNYDFARATDPSSSNSDSQSDRGSGFSMSIGAKAGIGLGVAVGVIAILLLALYFLRRKKKAKRAAVEAETMQGDDRFAKPELDGTSVGRLEKDGTDADQKYLYEHNHGAEQNHIVEAPAEVPAMNDAPWELHGNAITGELPASGETPRRGEEEGVLTESIAREESGSAK